MKKLNIIIFMLLVIIHLTISQDNDVLKLSIDDAVNFALAKNLGMKIEKINFNEKKLALYTVWNTFIPDLNASLSFSKVNQDILDDQFEKIKESYEDKGIDLTNSEVYDTEEWDNVKKGNITTSLNLTFDLSAKMIFDVAKVALDYKTGKISFEIAEKNIKKDVKKSYCNLIVLKENIKFLEKSLESAKKRYDLTERQFENDIISELDRLNSEYNFNDINSSYIEILNEYNNSISYFKKLLGIKLEVKLELIDGIQIFNDEKFFENENLIKYIEDNLDIKLIKSNINQKINERNLAIAEITPTFSIEYLVDPKFSRSDPFGEDTNWFYYEDDWQQDKGALTFTIKFNLSSLFPFSNEQVKIANANFNIQRYRLQLEDVRKNKELELASIIKEINKNMNNINNMELNLEMANKILKLSQLSYQNDLIDILKLIDSEKNLLDANFKLLNSKNSYFINIIDLSYLLNMDIPRQK